MPNTKKTRMICPPPPIIEKSSKVLSHLDQMNQQQTTVMATAIQLQYYMQKLKRQLALSMFTQ